LVNFAGRIILICGKVDMPDEIEGTPEEGAEKVARTPRTQLLTYILLGIAGLAVVVLTTFFTVWWTAKGKEAEVLASKSTMQGGFAQSDIEKAYFTVAQALIVPLDPAGKDYQPGKVKMDVAVGFDKDRQDDVTKKLQQYALKIKSMIQELVASKKPDELSSQEQAANLKLQLKNRLNQEVFHREKDPRVRVLEVLIPEMQVYPGSTKVG